MSRGQDEIPQARSLPIVGSAFVEIHASSAIWDLDRLATELGPIYAFDLPGYGRQIVLSGHELIAEVCDDERFDKSPPDRIRAVVGNGIFSADTDDPAWIRGHHLLAPMFSTHAVHATYPKMVEVAEQLCERLVRAEPGRTVDAKRLATDLTLETIGLCAFSHRFGTLYRDSEHPISAEVQEALELLGKGAGKHGLTGGLHPREAHRFRLVVAELYQQSEEMISDRRALGSAAPDDVLTRLLTQPQPDTGRVLDVIEVRDQLLTLVVAGHETTSGAIAFALHHVASDPEVQDWLREQVDDVLGSDPNALPTLDHLAALSRVDQLLSETLRLHPSAAMIARHARSSTLLGGRYPVGAGSSLCLLLFRLHRDPAVFGDDADSFRPQRWRELDELPPGAYLPFGTGVRACLGQTFARLEFMTALAMLVRRFEISDPVGAELAYQLSLTLKPRDLQLRFAPRPGVSALGTASAIATDAARDRAELADRLQRSQAVAAHRDGRHRRLALAYASDGGTTEQLCHDLAHDAMSGGDDAVVKSLDDWAGSLPVGAALVIVAASYNGKPAACASHFVRWLASAPAGTADGIRYAVFGCGDPHWRQTYQAVPHLLDAELRRLGGERILDAGEADTTGDYEGAFRAWCKRVWAALDASRPGPVRPRSALAEPFRARVLGPGAHYAPGEVFGLDEVEVIVNDELQRRWGDDPSGRSTRDIEVRLPPGTTYRPGDHLQVMPQNDDTTVWRAARALRFEPRQVVEFRRNRPIDTNVPLERPIELYNLLRAFFDVRAPATRAGIEALATLIHDDDRRRPLEKMAIDDAAYGTEVMERRLSLPDLAQEHPPDEPMPASLLPTVFRALKPRSYSISSALVAAPDRASITVGVLDAPALSGHGRYRGVTSSYLAMSQPGTRLLVRVRDPGHGFHPPSDPSVPMIMIGAGTGIAPFRGFLKQRAAEHRSVAGAGRAMLMRGCRRPDHDRVYGDELDRWVADGWLDLDEAFSRAGENHLYVQDRVGSRWQDIARLIADGASVYVCGNARTMAPAVAARFAELGASMAGPDWFDNLVSSQRYVEDIWGG